jgi:hypothetical protein
MTKDVILNPERDKRNLLQAPHKYSFAFKSNTSYLITLDSIGILMVMNLKAFLMSLTLTFIFT